MSLDTAARAVSPVHARNFLQDLRSKRRSLPWGDDDEARFGKEALQPDETRVDVRMLGVRL